MKLGAWLGAALVAGSLCGPAAQAETSSVLATAGFGLVGTSDRGYLATITVRSRFATGVTSAQDLVYEVHSCNLHSGQCQLSSQHVVPLSANAFTTRSNGTATLKTVWAGRPLVVRWERGGRGQFARAARPWRTPSPTTTRC